MSNQGTPITADIKPLENLPISSQSITIVVAALNEGKNLSSFLMAVERAFQTLNFDLPVLLIDDGSTDNTRELLQSLAEKYPFFQVIHHGRKRGLTQVLKTCLQHTQSDWLYFTGADLESDISVDLPLLILACSEGIDVVAGWRQRRGDGKKIASWIANLACLLMFGLKVHDMNWIKLVRREILLPLPLEKITHRFMLPVISALGYKIIEIPTAWFPRKAGKSKFGRKRLISSALDFFKLCYWFYFERFNSAKNNSFSKPSPTLNGRKNNE